MKIFFSWFLIVCAVLLLWATDQAQSGSFLDRYDSAATVLILLLFVFGFIGVASEALRRP